jgi:hypothetical protein
MRMSMRQKIEKVTKERDEAERAARGVPEEAEREQVVFMEDLLRDNPGEAAESLRMASGASNVVDLHEQFRDQFPWYTRVRRAMLRTRIRPHLISGIEFQMFVFIVGPLTGRILWTTVVSAALLMLFELVIMYKFWLSTRDYSRVMEELSPPDPTTGTIAPHLHRGRHRRAAQDELLTDERYRAPEPDEDPYVQPYPQPHATPHAYGIPQQNGHPRHLQHGDTTLFPQPGDVWPTDRHGAAGTWENSR